MEAPTKNGKVYEFDEFRLIPDEDLLFRNGEPVQLNPKAFRVLALLVERSGHLVQKSEILDLVWKDSFVEEGSLSKAIWFVRQALADTSKEKFIQTVPRRGYRFVFPVSVTSNSSGAFRVQDLHTPGERGTPIEGNKVTDDGSGSDLGQIESHTPPEAHTRISRLSKTQVVLACGVIGTATLAAILGFSGYFKSGSAAPRWIDLTFGKGGFVSDEANGFEGIAIQPDGKIVVASFHGFYPDYNIAVFRYNPDGSRDTTFDGDGRVSTDIGGRDAAHAVALQADGKILVGANSVGVSGSSFVVVRYNADGSLDTTFDDDGKAITFIGGEDAAHSIAVQPDGKVLVAGKGQGAHGLHDFALVRYNSNGSLDPSFGDDGIVTTDFNGSDDIANEVALLPDGKIIASGTGSELFAVVRYNSDGSLDTSFDGDGKVTTGSGVAQSVAVQPDGKIVAAGSSTNTLVLRRYNSDGSPDTTFGDDGTAAVNLQSSVAANSMVLVPDGRIVVAGSATLSSDKVDSSLVVVQYNSNGFRDKTFGDNGIVVLQGDPE